jgi:hypothetical protein
VKRAVTKSSPAKLDTVVARIKAALDRQWIPRLYRDEILTGRTRRYEFPAQATQGRVEVTYTLLGIELQVGRHRVLVPDWSTARYLSVFARIGVKAVAVPYDITRVSSLADELESAWQRMMLLVEYHTQGRSARFTALVRSRLVQEVREAISTLGAGQQYPQFDTSTKVYRRHSVSASNLGQGETGDG